MTVVALVARYALAVVFLHAGLVKLADLGEFRLAVGNYQLVPEPLLGAVAAGLPLTEVACAVLLATGVATGPTAAVLVILLGVFVVAIAVSLRRGRTFSCGCSGKNSSDITWRHVYVNAVLALLAALVSVWAAQPLTVAAGWGLPARPSLSAEAAVAILMATASVAVFLLLVSEARAVRRAMSVRGGPMSVRGGSDGPAPPGADAANLIEEVTG